MRGPRPTTDNPVGVDVRPRHRVDRRKVGASEAQGLDADGVRPGPLDGVEADTAAALATDCRLTHPREAVGAVGDDTSDLGAAESRSSGSVASC